MLKEYNTDVQRLFLQMMVTNSELYTRVMNIMNPENFDRSLRNVAEFIVEHTAKYSIMPDIQTAFKNALTRTLQEWDDDGEISPQTTINTTINNSVPTPSQEIPMKKTFGVTNNISRVTFNLRHQRHSLRMSQQRDLTAANG